MAVYLDMAATTPVAPEVRELVLRFLDRDFGNAGSRTHGYGRVAKEAVERARREIAELVASQPSEVILTSGATEANNLAILGMESYARQAHRLHVVSTAIEHKAVLEPLEELQRRGLAVTLVAPDQDGRVSAERLLSQVRDDTVLVSMMHVNNETGVAQPVKAVARALAEHDTFFHVDAAQGFGKAIEPLQDERIDLISVSGHKIFAPKGVGALIARQRRGRRCPLRPLMFGGGQERGLRPGTVPVHLVVGLGAAARIAGESHAARWRSCQQFRANLLNALGEFPHVINGSADHAVPHILNVSFPGVDAEAAMIALRDEIAISNGSACTSAHFTPSHVLSAMGASDDVIDGSIRMSWSHETEPVNWSRVLAPIRDIIGSGAEAR